MPGTLATPNASRAPTRKIAAGAIAPSSFPAARPSWRSCAASGSDECHDAAGRWLRSFGNEVWEFTESGLMRRREASINDVAIDAAERRLLWDGSRRPDDHPGLTELGF